MDKVTLGISGLEVSPIAFGTWQLGPDWGPFDEQEAIEAIRFARQRGVNLFDTAQGYGYGTSERLLGRALRDELDHHRDEIVIATKGGLRMTDAGQVRDSSPEWLREGVRQSLEELGVDYIDLYQVHWPDPDTPLRETGEALAQLVSEGRIRHVGVSNFSPAQMSELSAAVPVETLQPPYAMLRREIEAEVLPYCAEHHIGVLAYGVLAHGLLTGAIGPNPSFGPGDWRLGEPDFQGDRLARNLDVVKRLQAFADARGHTLSQLATAWVLANPAVQCAIIGTRSQRHIEEALAAPDIRFSAEEMAELDGILEAAVPLGGPTP